MKCHKRIAALFIPVLCLLLAVACTNTTQREAGQNAAPENEHLKQEIVTEDIYQGIIPVADDPDMEVKILLTLRPDHTYSERIEYANREGETIYHEGKYTREGTVLILNNQEGAKSYYQEEAGQLHSLDENRHPVSDPAQRYVLSKQPLEFSHPEPAPY